ncbi:MAG: FAD-dependent monooxygenase, partial [Planctomycetota bacterium]|nr:FAD-dependent monooxygenase [Planctomycetota bacterium]
MNAQDDTRVIIVGAGLAGCLLARLLGRGGRRVTVYERRGDPRGRGPLGGRSINLAISARGIDGLKAAGLEGHLRDHAIPMPGRMIHQEGRTVFQAYSASG